ncbi:MAG: glycine C-acetyltransferase [Gemmatimonadota bacterium]|jgi:glycine C-acetyltransferase|nr:glycine C-acetyltransferase [Gemmatimonadota bacterium]MDQ8152631.1 glycine C-acetyltransferase [Gemmatimonadota bacterium]
MNDAFVKDLTAGIDALKAAGTYKKLNHLDSPQAARVQMEGRGEVLILSSNNYLGLCDEPAVVQAGIDALKKFGAGTGSVRFICGTFTVHRELETAIARFAGTEASMSFVSAWNANEGLTASIVEAGDFVISDALNHASIIDSIRLAKAITKCTTAVYAHSDLDDLVVKLRANVSARRRIIWTDGVFSMEGSVAKLPQLLQIAEDHDAILVMDDSHATGVLGETGRGTAEHFGVLGEVDIITSTLGKALGGAAGGFVAGPAALCDTLTQRSRPQLFSNALPPTVAASALASIEYIEQHPERVRTLRENAQWFRQAITEAGFNPLPGETPIVPIIIGETADAIRMSELLLDEGIFVTGFGFPVVPQGTARLRCQISAAHTREDLAFAVEAIRRIGVKTGVIR